MSDRHFQDFLSASKYIQTLFTLEEIHEKWNDAKLGRYAKLTTVRRWLNNGPYTKNERFEPFISMWAEREFVNSDVLAVIAAELEVTRERVRQLQLRYSKAA